MSGLKVAENNSVWRSSFFGVDLTMRFDLGYEPHIKHAVRLIKNQGLHGDPKTYHAAEENRSTALGSQQQYP